MDLLLDPDPIQVASRSTRWTQCHAKVGANSLPRPDSITEGRTVGCKQVLVERLFLTGESRVDHIDRQHVEIKLFINLRHDHG
ncbi:hypothetical protein D3C76_792390 [compost metagenome]